MEILDDFNESVVKKEKNTAGLTINIEAEMTNEQECSSDEDSLLYNSDKEIKNSEEENITALEISSSNNNSFIKEEEDEKIFYKHSNSFVLENKDDVNNIKEESYVGTMEQIKEIVNGNENFEKEDCFDALIEDQQISNPMQCNKIDDECSIINTSDNGNISEENISNLSINPTADDLKCSPS